MEVKQLSAYQWTSLPNSKWSFFMPITLSPSRSSKARCPVRYALWSSAMNWSMEQVLNILLARNMKEQSWRTSVTCRFGRSHLGPSIQTALTTIIIMDRALQVGWSWSPKGRVLKVLRLATCAAQSGWTGMQGPNGTDPNGKGGGPKWDGPNRAITENFIVCYRGVASDYCESWIICSDFYLPKLCWALLRSIEIQETISIAERTLL